MLYRLIYISHALPGIFDESELDALLQQSRKDNARVGITGLLLFEDEHFMQVLEGDHEAVIHLYKDKISRDPRHEKVTTILTTPIKSRLFDSWAMAYHKIQPLEKELHDGYSHILGVVRDGGDFDDSFKFLEDYIALYHKLIELHS